MCCPARQKEFCLFIVSLRDQKNKEMIPTQQDIAEFTRFQRNEITESILYERLASIEKDENNRKTLRLKKSRITLSSRNIQEKKSVRTISVSPVSTFWHAY